MTEAKGKKVLRLIDYASLVKGKFCLGCGAPLRKPLVLGKGIEFYDHDSGYEVSGFERRQWLYVTCEKCGAQNSLVKLGVGR